MTTSGQETKMDCRVVAPIAPAAPVQPADWWERKELEVYRAIGDFDFPERPMRIVREFLKQTLEVKRVRCRFPYAQWVARFIKAEEHKVRMLVAQVAETKLFEVRWEGPVKRQALIVRVNTEPSSWNWTGARRFTEEEAAYLNHWRRLHQAHDPDQPLDLGTAERFRVAAHRTLWADELSLNEALSGGDIMPSHAARELIPAADRVSEVVPASRVPADPAESGDSQVAPPAGGVEDVSSAAGHESPGCAVVPQEPLTRPPEEPGAQTPGNLTGPEGAAACGTSGPVIFSGAASEVLDSPVPASSCEKASGDAGTLSPAEESLEQKLERLSRSFADPKPGPKSPIHLLGGNSAKKVGARSAEKAEAGSTNTRAAETFNVSENVNVRNERSTFNVAQQQGLLNELTRAFSGEIASREGPYPGEMERSGDFWWDAARYFPEAVETVLSVARGQALRGLHPIRHLPKFLNDKLRRMLGEEKFAKIARNRRARM